MEKLDVLIIGAGSAGLSARREVAKKTQNYKVINYGPLGTTCARVGCMPSKVLIQVANDFYRRKSFEQEGINGGEKLTLDSKKALAHVRSLRDRFVRAVVNDMESWKNEKLIDGMAKFKTQNIIEVNGQEYQADKIIMACGSRPNIPEVYQGFEDFLITTDEIFEQEDLPSSIAVVGLGVIGLELGQALHRLGVEVVGITRSKRLAGVSDPEINDYVISKFSEEMNINFGGVTKLERHDGGVKIFTPDKEFVVKKILLTSGRVPNIDQIGFSNLNPQLLSNEIPKHNKETFQLEEFPHIYIAGDLTAEKQLLHEASDEGKIAGFNSVNGETKFKTRTPLNITFCDPNIANTGLTFKELEESGIEFEIGKVSFEGQGRSIVKLKEIGLLHVYGDKKTGKILGAEMYGPEMEHIAHLLSWVISQDMTVNEVLALPFYHPVIEEGLRTSLRNLREKVLEQAPPLEIYPSKDL